MSLKTHIKPFVPPVLWSAVSGRTKGRPPARATRQMLETVTQDRFVVDFHRPDHPDGAFFVPAYGTHRPAATEILAGRLFEPDTHALV
jgi:hypothetical protein